MTNVLTTLGNQPWRAATGRPTYAASLLGRRDVAVLFDFNGVLIDDEPIHFQAFRRVLAADGHLLRPEDYRRYLGLDDRGTFLTLLTEQGADIDAELLDDWIATKQRLYAELTQDGVHLFPGARELIVALDRAGVALAIVSGARRAEIERALETAGLAACFSVVIAADSVARPKPDPEGYRAAFDLLAARFPRVTTGVAIEDAPAGIHAARAAGLACIGVTTSCTPHELRGADRVVDSLRQLRLVEAT
ncbi:MAG TPA: HAD family phosphatase [Polyangia bacterium]|jgi:HAD superfamily hydrolase (TIGR01509 family)